MSPSVLDALHALGWMILRALFWIAWAFAPCLIFLRRGDAGPPDVPATDRRRTDLDEDEYQW